MAAGPQDAVEQLRILIDEVDARSQRTFQNMHQGYPKETLMRFLKAREWNVPKAYKMLVDCFEWRTEKKIDNILAKPIPSTIYKKVRDSQLIGLSGYSKETSFWLGRYGDITAGLPVFGVGAGLSTFDKASIHDYVQSHIQINEYRDRVVLPTATRRHGRHICACIKIFDMTGLKLSALGHIKLLTTIATIDDLNYPEKTNTYYIVNAPYIFSSCWKIVKPLLHERTRNKVQVLQGCGKDELLKRMDYSALPHFCRREGSGSSWYSSPEVEDCFTLDHPFHQELYNYVKQQSRILKPVYLIKEESFNVDVPDLDTTTFNTKNEAIQQRC